MIEKKIIWLFSENNIATEDPWNPLKNDNFCKFGSKFHNFAYKCIGYSFLTIILFVGQIKIWIKCILKFDSYGTQIVLWSWSVVHTWKCIWNFLYQYISNCRCQKTPITPVRNQERAPRLLRERSWEYWCFQSKKKIKNLAREDTRLPFLVKGTVETKWIFCDQMIPYLVVFTEFPS